MYRDFNSMGVSYKNESNYYNAFEAFETSISNESHFYMALFNQSCMLDSIGLQKLSLSRINGCISYFERKKKRTYFKPEYYYSFRSNLYRQQGKYDLMLRDIKKSFEFDYNYYYSMIVRSRYYAEHNRTGEALSDLSLAVLKEPKYSLSTRGEFFRILNNYERFIDDFDKSFQISTFKTFTLYRLGLAHYLKGDIEKSEDCYNQFISKGKHALSYKGLEKNVGIVEYIDNQRNFGFVITNTWFNTFDKVYFKLNDCKEIPKEGSRVRFKLEYKVFKEKLVPNAVEVEPYDILNESFRDYEVYHGIIHTGNDFFKSTNSQRFVYLFYPYKEWLSFDMIASIIEDPVKNELKRNGYTFVELKMSLSQFNIPEIKSAGLVPKYNRYSNKEVGSHRDIDYDRYDDSRRTCPVCGLNEWCGSDGCPMDPT